MREKVGGETRILRTWTLKEIKETRDMFKVPGIIGIPLLVKNDDDLSQNRILPKYNNFNEFVNAVS